MPLAVALLCHPIGTYGFFVVAVASLVYARPSRTFVPTFSGIGCSALTLLAFVQVPPDYVGLALLALGVALLHCEFVVPTYGVALGAGLLAGTVGSWLMLGGMVSPAVPPVLRIAVALSGTLVLLGAVVRAARLRTLSTRGVR
jgi:membrane-bound ClpP family serine protease